ncbi:MULTISPECIES: GNAT family N-acetyltransferase [unclassified Pseudonocardia]|uniref:GNAT family N-acetyltransferase n=1 Tax=unclassified Pseudonocardia TaxID=2619320 RepID=UPI0025E64A36|nr:MULTISPECIES: GNAT family N-acetyltransferase [unclassified Pseudonocardia]
MELDALVGHRVALRHRIGDRDGRPLYSDAVGELTTDGDDVLVAARRGQVRVARAAVVAVRAVPPAPPRRASLTAIARLENLCADAWPAQVDEPLGDWRLRAAGGYTGRANSALAVGSPGMPTAAALDAVRTYAARNGIGPRVQVPAGTPWDTAVAGGGWTLDVAHEAGAESTVQVVELDALRRTALSSEPLRRTCRSSDRPDAAWWGVVAGGEPSPARRGVLDPASDLPLAFLQVPGSGALRAALVEDHVHLSALAVDPAARRRGLASALLAAAAEWGLERGARFGVLQVALHNTGARTLYAGLGFVEHHRYRYLVPPS